MIGNAQRFGGIERLFGRGSQALLWASKVAVVGLGGVGSWTAEALIRSGVGQITLVDMDIVSITNTNRQLHALDGTIGQPKAVVMAERLSKISPDARIECLQARFDETTADGLLPKGFHAVVDAIDQPAHKALLIAICRARGFSVFTSGGAAGRRNPGLVRVTDLALSSHDRLLAEVRRLLRRQHGFPAGDTPFGVDCVFSPEAPFRPVNAACSATSRDISAATGPDCRHGMGTAAFVTGTFGFALAGLVVRWLIAGVSTSENKEAADD
jgi:tRNA A37 threonylcarbamoyladenosine dehydratase